MIVTEFVNLKVNINNIDCLKESGYQDLKFKEIIEVKVEDLSKGSHVKLTVKCDVCGNIRENLMYKEYLRNLESGGYYSCKGKCSSDKNRKTNMEKYGVDNPSKCEEIKNKKMQTSLKNYGVEYYSKTEESKMDFKNKCLDKYGVDNPSKSEEVKQKRGITMCERHGVEYYVLHQDFLDKSKETSVRNYGVDHPMKLRSNVERCLNSKGMNFETSEFKKYRNEVDKLTRKNKHNLLSNWNGYDFYDGEYIRDNFNLIGQHGDYPTIDHKISVHFGFINEIKVDKISCLENLCLTKRRINSKKNNKIDFTL